MQFFEPTCSGMTFVIIQGPWKIIHSFSNILLSYPLGTRRIKSREKLWKLGLQIAISIISILELCFVWIAIVLELASRTKWKKAPFLTMSRMTRVHFHIDVQLAPLLFGSSFRPPERLASANWYTSGNRANLLNSHQLNNMDCRGTICTSVLGPFQVLTQDSDIKQSQQVRYGYDNFL